METNERILTLSRWVKESDETAVLTGAGVSTESGVPDFRSPGGIWDQYDLKIMRFERFLSEPEIRKQYWQFYLEAWEEFSDVKPNPAHESLAHLAENGAVDAIITQNIDGLHRRAGTPLKKIIRLHGYMWKVVCLDCGAEFSHRPIKEKLESTGVIPRCPKCGGLLKPATVDFGQPLPEEEIQRAHSHSLTSDLFICVGTSLAVQPASLLPEVAKDTGARLAIINRDKTALDDTADLLVRGMAGEILNSLRDMVL